MKSTSPGYLWLVWLGFLLWSGCATPTHVEETPLSYRARGDEQVATLHAPKGHKGPWPAVVLLHGGFFGAGDKDQEIARMLTGRGYLAAVPAYRGQQRLLDGERAGGSIEFCAGEVEDALALLKNLRRRSDVDKERIAVWGFSHGGCIALLTAAADPHLRAVVSFAAPTDAAAFYRRLRDRPLLGFGFHGWLASRLRIFVGGEPEGAPQRYWARSPLRVISQIQAPLLVVHGLSDEMVEPEHSCWLRDTLRKSLRPIQERRFAPDGSLLPPSQGTPACGKAEPDPSPEAPGKAPAEVWFFEGQGHGFRGQARDTAYTKALDFLSLHLGKIR